MSAFVGKADIRKCGGNGRYRKRTSISPFAVQTNLSSSAKRHDAAALDALAARRWEVRVKS